MDFEDRVETELEKVQMSQWQRAGNVFTASGATTPELPPGYYKLVEVWGEPRFIHQRIEISGILRLPTGNIHEVMQDMEHFWNNKQRFDEFKLPYKRGILMSGPPGTGKTCVIKLVLKDIIKRKGICITTDDFDALQKALQHIRQIQPDNPVVVVLEDFEQHGRNPYLLNIMDGIVSVNNVVFLATTNHPEKVDEALINRPGRFDRHVKINPPCPDSRRVFIDTFRKGYDIGVDMEQIVRDTEGLSFGHLKEMLVGILVFGQDYDSVLKRLRNMTTGETDE